MIGRMGYELAPMTVAELRSSCRGQIDAMKSPDYDPRLDGVLLTPQAILDLVDIVLCAVALVEQVAP